MKRITIAALITIFSTVAGTGCIEQTSSTVETNDQSVAATQPNDVDDGTDQAAHFKGGPSQALELDVRVTSEGEGPHPEPWLDQQGPHPEPWTGRAIIIVAPDSDPSGTKKP
jgi:hypothetical protein